MALLALHDVHFSFGTREVLAGVSLEVAAGERIAILGRNGAGKSTLLRVASGYLSPRRGTVRLEGRELADVPRREAARRLAGVSAQESFDFPFRVREAVLLGRHPWRGAFGPALPADLACVSAALAATDLVELAERRLPTLSSGERQRVAVARALAQTPDAFLLDEPTAHLDLGHQARLLEVLGDEARVRGAAVLAVLHDVNVAADWADRLVLLCDGRVEACGRPSDVLTSERLARAFGGPVDLLPAAGRATPWIVARGRR